MKNKLVLFYVPFPHKNAAMTLCRQALKHKLAACANLYQSDSIYFWENKLHEEEETTAIFKTSIQKQKVLKKFIKSKHPYDCPAIIKIKAKCNKKYLKWLLDQL